jgi:hypothetical protein
VREAVIVLWEAADRICGKRLRAVIPRFVEALERHGAPDYGPCRPRTPVGSNYPAQLQMPRRTGLAAPRPSARSGA